MFIDDVECEVKKTRRSWKRLTEAEVDEIWRMHENGFTADQIATAVDRAVSTVYLKLRQSRG